jgi:pimeloyl-ACP methyl ester carboxylesterase
MREHTADPEPPMRRVEYALKTKRIEVQVRDIRMEAVEALPEHAPNAETVICVHGFPDNLHSFDLVLPDLAAAGFRALSVGLPGYSPKSLIPDGNYSLPNVARYMLGFLDALGLKDVHYVGHDFGGIIAADMVDAQPERIRRLAVLSYFPLYKNRENMRLNIRQFYNFWYVTMIVAGTGWIEEAAKVADYGLLDVIWRTWSPGWEYPKVMLDDVKRTFRRKGVTAAAMSYYHQRKRPPEDEARVENLEFSMPTLMVGGITDGCATAGMFKSCDTSKYVGGFKLAMLESGHFPQRENPVALCAELIPFLTAG